MDVDVDMHFAQALHYPVPIATAFPPFWVVYSATPAKQAYPIPNTGLTPNTTSGLPPPGLHALLHTTPATQ